MSNETSKLKNIFTEKDYKILSGKGIDIGCGKDPIFPDVRRFDIEDGDANKISKYVKEEFDFVFSSHCLEHMYNPYKTIMEWWKLLKYGGYLYFLVPDEDLYEQGIFPSTFNSDHKHTFTIYKRSSWCNKSVNIFNLIKKLKDAKVIKIELQDEGYDYNITNRIDQTLNKSMAQICVILKKENAKYKNLNKYSKLLINLVCAFIPKKNIRDNFRKNLTNTR